MYYALIYETVPDYVARRAPYRDAHLALATRAHAEGLLVMGGAFDPADAALLVFRAESPAAVEAFVRADPYVQNGLVTSWRIRPWKVVVGGSG